MQWRIISVGKPGHDWVKGALVLYSKRLQHYARLEHVMIKEGPRDRVEQQISNACEDGLCVVLDERGRQLRSVDMARWIENEEITGRKRVCLVIGGADGHSPEFRAKAAVSWSLSNLTLQHDIALIVLMEQVYRAYTIMRGEPYHRE
ncbi:MAG: 23S rRNA (pseudouridine(1915)-N(3))-methyltransferase RlmH [Prosthecobacter sp.]|jgi:23S rRNA (pseudouridine1915-N3)-methyltransferase|uniref:23S rRNA (pseudouridine(1915)-N(3))-methyltransferase RlmH n=1 Tax=Prosthecobacter sp. TaxID=1965333 RepID=UPI0019D9A89E|nr:23S rRNA (pseudouridine(1915)-N(3))-methyltransferase RlmH [Prosthecobacter sp.]MBE2285222.1 23S rRNA (pseudouridine(1915)-N(3))-methyltransferase RlmH [Prosthecobacter sp.]